jgi:hypothetical protein
VIRRRSSVGMVTGYMLRFRVSFLAGSFNFLFAVLSVRQRLSDLRSLLSGGYGDFFPWVKLPIIC